MSVSEDSTEVLDGRILNARPDTLDFRDRMWQASLIEVPPRRPLDDYRGYEVPVLDQGQEGACTGFGLATVANFLLKCRSVDPDGTPVSARMLYELARRYDEWPGEQYSGSSARGAMKGWHKHGVCKEITWPYNPQIPDNQLTDPRAEDAADRPLGSYGRVNHKDLVCMHAALAEVGILYATAKVHKGWSHVPQDGRIPFSPDPVGGHAFAIVAYDKEGFWIQNSWGAGWGKDGFGHLTYDDWLANGTDVWVARLGVPVHLTTREAEAATRSAAAGGFLAYSYRETRPHVVSLGNDGVPRTSGPFATSAADIKTILLEDFPRLTKDWGTRRILIYAHGGLVPEATAIQRVTEYGSLMMEKQVYPLALSWNTDYWSTLRYILEDANRSRRPEGFLRDTFDFMLDRLDDFLESVVRTLSGKAQWDQMKQNALSATEGSGGARIVADVSRS